jgi:AcrR family transcriptional regulator
MTNDHLVQRARIAEVTADVIAREGINSATVRRIAAELNCSTSIVTYYFADKHELLISAYKSLHDELYEKVDAVLRRDQADLVGCLFCMTAAEEVSFKRWRTYVALWDQAARDERWAAKERQDVQIAIAKIEAVIFARNGNIENLRGIALDLNAFVQGISVQAMMDPEGWPTERLRSRIEAVIDKFLGPPAASHV